MLDLDHPQSAHRIAAAKQIDLILDYAKRITTDDGRGRQFMNNVVAPCFAALHWLNENHFDNDPVTRQRIADLQSALGGLATRQVAQCDPPFERKTCPVCQQTLTKPSQYDPTAYCPDCLDVIMPALTLLDSHEGGFGTVAI